MHPFLRFFIMFCKLFISVIFVGFIFDAMEALPKYEELDFHTGTIKYVGIAEGRKSRRHIPIILSTGVNEKHFKMPASIDYKNLKLFQGSQATIGTWTHRSGPFFIRETETWHLVIDGKILYDYKARFDRTSKNKPYKLAIILLCSAPAIVILFRTQSKNMEIK